MFRPTHAVVDLQKIRHNARELKRLVGTGFFCPMVKANAYGHGDVPVVKAVADTGVERIGVALVEEGVGLRRQGIASEILVFGRLTPESARAILEFRLTPVLSSWADFEILSLVQNREPIPLHIKIDTGMRRMGFSVEEVPRLKDFFHREKRLRCVGICTHLSHGEDAGVKDGRSERQISLFHQIFSELEQPSALHHVLNSEALLARSRAGLDCSWLGARPGLALYGLCEAAFLQPAMSLLTRLDLVRRVEKGESVSYGGRWTASKKSWVGIVPLGYGDGYWRSFSNKGHMLYRGQRVPVVGTVCMDYSLLDLTNACVEGEPKSGEEIVVFGTQREANLSVVELTRLVDTIPYELVTGISARVPRVYR